MRSAVGVERLDIRLLREECRVVGAAAIESSSVERARHDQTPRCPAAVHGLPRHANRIDRDVSASIGTCTQTGPAACDAGTMRRYGLIRAKQATLLCRRNPHVDDAHQRQCHLLKVDDSRSRVMRRSEHGPNLRVETGLAGLTGHNASTRVCSTLLSRSNSGG